MVVVFPLFVLLTALLIFREPHELLHPVLLENPELTWAIGAGVAALALVLQQRRRTLQAKEDREHVAKLTRRVAELTSELDAAMARSGEHERAATAAGLAATAASKRAGELETALKEAQLRAERLEASRGDLPRREEIDAELVHLLSLLQERGRLLDFLMDDITKYPNDQVGAAARLVHQGCRALINEYFDIVPVHQGREGDSVVLETDYLPERYRLVGKLVTQPPFRGVLLHAGWRTMKVSLPRLIVRESASDQPSPAAAYHREIIAPAEVEVQ